MLNQGVRYVQVGHTFLMLERMLLFMFPAISVRKVRSLPTLDPMLLFTMVQMIVAFARPVISRTKPDLVNAVLVKKAQSRRAVRANVELAPLVTTALVVAGLRVKKALIVAVIATAWIVNLDTSVREVRTRSNALLGRIKT